MLRLFSSSSSSVVARRAFSSSVVSRQSSLHDRMATLIPKERERVKSVKEKYGSEIIGTCTVDQAYGGMRSVKSMVTETSLLDTEEGIRFRGLSIPECQEQLPRFTPEALLWLLLTGEVPTAAQVDELEQDIHKRAQAIPAHSLSIVDSLPKDMHPMTQLTTGVLALQTESHFARAYQSGQVRKTEYWESTLEDALDCIARVPTVAARIYRNVYHGGAHCSDGNAADLSSRFANQLGFTDSADFHELMRMYLVIHSDHEGGNVSAHATHLVGSALSDPYLSLAGGLTGLAGPLHGLANQEVLTWLMAVRKELGEDATDYSDELVRDFLWSTLKAGRVVPGYGHAVLRKTDPRYEAQRQFALKHLPDDPLFRLVSQVYKIAPEVLREHGKAANPWPNVDAHSGCLLVHYGLTEQHYYTVLFGVSRALGVLASLTWDRALLLPLERPKSVTTGWIENHFANK